MFTLCPKCALTLVVTAADLRIAQGYVRCGRCLNVFNALSRLSEERPTAPPELPPDTTAALPPEEAPTPTEETLAPAEETPEPSSTIDETGEIDIELDASVFVTSVRPPTAPQMVAEPEAQPEEPEPAGTPAPAATAAATPHTETLSRTAPATPDASAPAPATTAPITTAPVTTAPLTAAPIAPSSVAITSATPAPAAQQTREPDGLESAGSAAPLGETREATQTNTSQQSVESVFELRTQRPRVELAWRIGAVVLAIGLLLQIVNHYRDALAANSALRGPLSTVYAALGVKLAPRWDIHAYDVRQLGASVAGATAGQIVVRASVKNSASRAQPLPLLRVTLQDRFGNRIAARDVPPGDYLPSSVAPSSLLAAGSRVDATMVFVDPGPQAVGFEIDACLRQRSGAVACAHGP